jgi:hypothetical protein
MRSGHGVFARVVVGLVATLAVAAVSVGAAAAQQQPEPRPPVREPTFLWLLTQATDGTIRFATLTCDPPGGFHPEAAAACRALAAAEGDFAKLPSRGGACPHMYYPIRAAAFGQWRGTPVNYGAQYGNPCLMLVETGPVFDL